MQGIRRCGWMMLVGLVCLTPLGCATVKTAIDRAVCDLTNPGQKREETSENTAKERNCRPGMTTLVFVSTTVSPDPATPGKDLCHRITYASCPAVPSQTYAVTVIRTVFYKGMKVWSDSDNNELKPGTWHIDSKIPLPSNASPGPYAVATTIKGSQINETKSAEFVVGTGSTRKER
jgi:hypothetical protein